MEKWEEGEEEGSKVVGDGGEIWVRAEWPRQQKHRYCTVTIRVQVRATMERCLLQAKERVVAEYGVGATIYNLDLLLWEAETREAMGHPMWPLRGVPTPIPYVPYHTIPYHSQDPWIGSAAVGDAAQKHAGYARM